MLKFLLSINLLCSDPVLLKSGMTLKVIQRVYNPTTITNKLCKLLFVLLSFSISGQQATISRLSQALGRDTTPTGRTTTETHPVTNLSQPDSLNPQERLRHLQMLAKRQRELKALALARQQRTSSVDTALGRTVEAIMAGTSQAMSTNNQTSTNVGGQINAVTSSTHAGLNIKQTRSLSESALPPLLSPDQNLQADRWVGLEPSSNQQQAKGSQLKLQQLLEIQDSPPSQGFLPSSTSAGHSASSSMANAVTTVTRTGKYLSKIPVIVHMTSTG